MNILRKITFIIILFLSSYSVFAKDGGYYIDGGVALFRIGEYAQSIDNFKKVITEDRFQEYRADAYFWISKAYIATGKLADAEKNLEYFLINFPDNDYYEEAAYQKGRLLFLQRDYENCILECNNFIENFSNSMYIPNSYYWLGETLYSLGRLEEAEKVFLLITQKYPVSFKVKDSKYRLELIEQKHREESLIKLLKLTHEEYYKVIEELQLREKTYEAAIESFQKKIIQDYSKNNTDTAYANDLKYQEVTALKNELGEKNVEIRALKRKISDLEYRLNDNDYILLEDKVLSPAVELELNQLKERTQTVRDYYLKYLDDIEE